MLENTEKIDKEKVAEFFITKKIEARPISSHVKSKEPDFELYIGGKLWGYCELKSISKDNWTGGLRSDPTYNNIQNKIHESHKQLKAANPKHEFPNIICFINHHTYRGYIDLITVLTGKYSLGNPDVTDFRYLKRLIARDAIDIIDCIIWMEKDNKISFMFNSDSTFIDVLKEKIGSKDV